MFVALVLTIGIVGPTPGHAWAKAKSYPSFDGKNGPLVPPVAIEGSYSKAVLLTPAGEIDCAAPRLHAMLLTNGMKSDEFVVTAMTFYNPCSDSLGGPAPTLVTEPPPNGWTGILATTGKFTIDDNVTVRASFPPSPLGPQNEEVCRWTTRKLKGTFNTEGPITLSTEQGLKLDRGSGFACPKTATLTANWALGPQQEQEQLGAFIFLGSNA
jgi:hypothetical protein